MFRTSTRTMARYVTLILIGAGLAAQECLADLYSWTDPQTGRPHISSSPPPWYSPIDSKGRRTLVTSGNILIDDTGLSPAARARLQQKAAAALGRERLKQEAAKLVETAAAKPAAVAPGVPGPADKDDDD